MDGDGVSPPAKTVIEVPQVALTLLGKQMPPVEVCFDDRVSQLLVTHCELQISQILLWLSPLALQVAPYLLIPVLNVRSTPSSGYVCPATDRSIVQQRYWY